MNSSRVFIILSILLVLIWLLVDETEAQFEGPIRKRRRRGSGKRRRCCRNRRHRNDGDKKNRVLKIKDLQPPNERGVCFHFIKVPTTFFRQQKKNGALISEIFWQFVLLYSSYCLI